jgi:ATP-dependent Clp protease protease subunit
LITRPKYFNVTTSESSGDIFIYGIIGSSWFEESNRALDFLIAFKALEEKFPRINVHINSPGGDIWEGLPIINAIRSSKSDVHTYVDGIAFSMASLIAISAKPGNVHIASNGMLMFHNASSGVFGNANDFRTAAEALDAHDQSLLQTVIDRTGESNDTVNKNFFNYKDNFFSAQQAKDSKLVDVIEDYKAEKMPANPANMKTKDLFAFYSNETKEPSESLISRITSTVVARLTPIFSNKNQNSIQSENMDFKNSLAALAKDTLSAEDKAAVIAEINSFTGVNEKFTATEVQAKIDAAIKDANDKAVKAQEEATQAKNALEELKNSAVGGTGKAPVQNGADKIHSTTKENEFETSVDAEVKRIQAQLEGSAN